MVKLVELGDALMNLVEGPHTTMIDTRIDGDPHALRAKARSLVTRFEKLGRSRDTLMVGVSRTKLPWFSRVTRSWAPDSAC